LSFFIKTRARNYKLEVADARAPIRDMIDWMELHLHAFPPAGIELRAISHHYSWAASSLARFIEAPPGFKIRHHPTPRDVAASVKVESDKIPQRRPCRSLVMGLMISVYHNVVVAPPDCLK
jgi:hypothetical protein